MDRRWDDLVVSLFSASSGFPHHSRPDCLRSFSEVSPLRLRRSLSICSARLCAFGVASIAVGPFHFLTRPARSSPLSSSAFFSTEQSRSVASSLVVWGFCFFVCAFFPFLGFSVRLLAASVLPCSFSVPRLKDHSSLAVCCLHSQLFPLLPRHMLLA